ncbi:GGDEF domain-containing protein [sulfur-oxidizing endosymbiont of Gigantopelta aegis]|uniref:GGDEF domain-containing protein n=1 Tax=sulfur-oxidizing endosymbiont of Gigantopelta aegis TaxID=2794934 RepID=UPI0018DD6907|nr:GGDEF domain-containing protein [sulfur-oxidizing endosymbiont of Gigantopelta aegis]
MSHSSRISKTIDNLSADKQTLLELSNKLHSTLDLDSLITLLKLDITPILNLDDMLYQTPENTDSIDPKGRHLISYQLVLQKKNLGEIALIRRTRFNDKEQQFIEKILVALLSPLNNALEYQHAMKLALHDPLTGVFNRFAMDSMVSREIDLSQRNNTPLAMLAIDIDFFKRVNDNYGHAYGDAVLKQMTKCVKECTRTSDAMFRYGGEEFNLLLNNTDLSGAQELAERIRQHIETTACEHEGQSTHITVSIGISILNDDDNQASFFKRADNGLYQAKKNGRNQVVNSKK